MEPKLKCISCSKELTNDKGSTRFRCPNCAAYEIIRCRHCRELATQYHCPSCSFTGPN